MTFMSLYSKKLHIFGFLERIIVVRSLVIFFFSFSVIALYHFCNLNLPCLLNSSMKLIYKKVSNTFKHISCLIRNINTEVCKMMRGGKGNKQMHPTSFLILFVDFILLQNCIFGKLCLAPIGSFSLAVS